MRRGVRSALIAGLLLCPVAALCHDADLIYARAVRAGATGQVTESMTMTAETLARLAPVDADGDSMLTQADLDARTDALEAGVWEGAPLSAGGAACRRGATRALVRSGYVELTAAFSCGPGALSQRFKLLELLPREYQVVLSYEVDGAVGQRHAQGNVQSLEFEVVRHAAGPMRVSGLPGWFKLGVFHILTGVDHLAFLVALLLVSGPWRKVFWMVTAFTLAHSITLAIAALDLVPLSAATQHWIEALIAVSIVWVAIENLVLRDARHRWALAFGFGLVHGFAFASTLQGHGLGDAVVMGLLGFNLGVEAGQACVVALLLPALKLLKRRPAASVWLVRAASVLILGAGGYWLVERVLS